MSKERFDIHQHVTDKIVSAIERGAGDFRLPWHRSAGSIMRPVNVASKKRYRGVNVVALWTYAEESDYSSGVWGTYRQWAEAGAQVRKGEKAAFVVFYKELEFAAEIETGDADTITRLFARATPVFAAEQVDGYQPPVIDAPPSAGRGVIAPPPSSQRGRGSSSRGDPFVPPREAFIGPPTSTPAETYYSTLLHELTHWTGDETRCNRQLGKRFDDHAYALEELVAELGAAFLRADLGITDEPRADHAQWRCRSNGSSSTCSAAAISRAAIYAARARHSAEAHW